MKELELPEQRGSLDGAAPPHDLNAEMAVLGAMLMSKEAIAEAVEVLKPEHFYKPAHAMIFEATVGMYLRGETADPITLSALLTQRGESARVGGSAYLFTLTGFMFGVGSVRYYAEIVRETWSVRQVIIATRTTLNIALRGEGTASELVAAQQQALLAAVDEDEDDSLGLLGPALEDFHDDYEERAANAGKLSGVSTGFADLDSLTGGFQPGQLIVVAGRPAMGKSTLAMDFVRACSLRDRQPSVFFSLEMSRREITRRVISAQARVPLHHITHAILPDELRAEVDRTTAELMDAPMWIDDSAGLNLVTISAKARKLHERHGLKLGVIDYLQLMQSGAGRRPESRQQEVSDISRGLKLLGKELGIPIIALSQLNRGPENRTDKKPVVSDLRESGAIEQDADMVILLHREDAYEKESPRAGEADLIVAKHRNGPTATITTAFQGHYSRFVDMAST
ncbi:replicative DNA helicase [Streptomyces globosus]|uniref:replicative DNA helicase n=1 Tax=Streptomyces globosus TaxID=68209 RepID=UPI0031D844CD